MIININSIKLRKLIPGNICIAIDVAKGIEKQIEYRIMLGVDTAIKIIPIIAQPREINLLSIIGRIVIIRQNSINIEILILL